jgi:hypothetical protein
MTPTHDSPTRLTVAQWAEEARLSRACGRDDLVLICLNEAAIRAAEGDKTLAEMLTEGAEQWTP